MRARQAYKILQRNNMVKISYCMYKKISKHQAESLNGFGCHLMKSWKKNLKRQAKIQRNNWIQAKYNVHPYSKTILIERNKRSKTTFKDAKKVLSDIYTVDNWEFHEGYVRYDREYNKHRYY